MTETSSVIWFPCVFLLFQTSQCGEIIFSIAENLDPGTMIGRINSSAPPPFLVLGAGIEEDLNVDQGTGDIRTRIKLDREKCESYSFVLIPLSGGESVRVRVDVTDVNDNPPTFPTGFVTLEFPENSPRDLKRTLPPAQDRDTGKFNTEKYIIISGNMDEVFRLHSHRERDGVLYLDLGVNGLLDRETIPFYTLVIEALDGGNPPLRGTLTLHISIKDTNDNSPIFNQSKYFGTIWENSTVGTPVLQVFATDTDSGKNAEISYSINRRQSDKESYFQIHATTGLITLNRHLDFQTKELHELLLTATDGGAQPLESNVFVSIRVVRVIEDKPLISILFLTRNKLPKISEGIIPATEVALITLRQPGIDLSLTGSRGHFQLVKRMDGTGMTALVVGSKGLDREKYPEYTLTVIGSNQSSVNTSTSFRLQIEDINDNVPLFPDSDFYATVTPTSSFVTQVTAIDPDEGQNAILHYSLSSTRGSELFEIDSSSGIIRTRTMSNFNENEMISLQVIATDSGIPSLSSRMTVHVQLLQSDHGTDANNYPMNGIEGMTLDRIKMEVSEGCPPGYLVGSLPPIKGSRFQIRTNDDTFGIDNDKNYLVLLKPLDFEIRAEYSLSLNVIDTEKEKFDVLPISVIVTDENEPSHFDVKSPLELSISEDSPPGSPVSTFHAFDPDRGLNGTLKYSLVQQKPSPKFRIDSTTGSLVVDKWLDRELEENYVLVISAIDQGRQLNRRLGSQCIIYINIDDVNDNDPIFKSETNVIILPDDTPDSFVHSVIAVDMDSGINAQLAYNIESGNENGFFILDSNGQLSLTRPVVVPSNFTLKIIASDQGKPPRRTAQYLKLSLNDLRTVGTEFSQRSYIASIKENSLLGSVIMQISAKASRGTGPLSYAIAGANAALFKIDQSTGEVRVAGGLDREIQSQFTLTAFATDENGVHHAKVPVLIFLSDVNDNAPSFKCPNLRVPENQVLGVIHHFIATDLDEGQNGEVSWSITGGNSRHLFSINSKTGEFSAGSLDREDMDVHILTISAEDGGKPRLRMTCNLTLIIDDENDNSPIFNQHMYEKDIDENLELGTEVLRVVATDADAGRNSDLIYELRNGSQFFRIDRRSGVIFVSGKLDRELNPYFEIEVVATDGSVSSPRSASVQVRIKLNDRNDNPPRFTNCLDSISISTDMRSGTWIYRASASDSDIGANAEIRYELNPNETRFRIHPENGELSIAGNFRRQPGDIIPLSIIAKDKGLPPLVSKLLLVIRNGDISEGLDFSQNYKAILSKNAGFGSHVIQVEARRRDGRRQDILYSVIDGNENEIFGINHSSGSIFRSERSLPKDVDIIELIVEARAGNMIGYTVVTISINSEDSTNVPQFSQSSYVSSVLEGTAKGTFLAQLSAYLPRADPSRLLYYISEGNEDNAFVLDPPWEGILRTNVLLDREVHDTYRLILIVSDESSPQIVGTTVMDILVLDVNDNPPTFPPNLSFTLNQDTEIGTLVGVVGANDVDSNPNLTYDLIDFNNDEYFWIGKYSGEVFLLKSLQNSTLDKLTLEARVSDGIHEGRTLITFNIKDVESNIPKFSQDLYELYLTGEETVGSTLLTVDIMSGKQNVMYSLHLHHNNGNFLDIRPDSGQIFLKSIPSRRPHSSGFGEAVIVATDKHNPSLSSNATVYITTSSTTRFQFPEKFYSVTIADDMKVGTALLELGSQLETLHAETKLVYTIAKNSRSEFFGISRGRGTLVITKEIKSVGNYTLAIEAVSVGFPKQSAKTTVHIFVFPTTHVPPVDSVRNLSLSERREIGNTILQLPSEYGYTLVSTSPKFQINDGKIIQAERIEYNSESNTQLVLAGQLTKSKLYLLTVNIQIEDVNEHAPEWPVTSYLGVIQENQPIRTALFQAFALDKDSRNETLTYSIVESTVIDKISIDSKSGLVSTIVTFDYEKLKQFSFTIRAIDSAGLEGRVKATVEILSQDEFQPQFSEEVYEFRVPSNADKGYLVGSVMASDPDEGRDGIVQYQLVNSNDRTEAFLIEVDSELGEIKLKDALTINRTFVIKASTGLATSKSGTALVQLFVGPPVSGLVSSSFPDWLIGALAMGILVVLVLLVLIIIYLRRRYHQRRDEVHNMKSVYPGTDFNACPFVQGNTLDSRGTSLYSPPEYMAAAPRSLRPNPSELSTKSKDSASSGRGSVEDDEDEEIRMINEGQAGDVADGGQDDEPPVTNTEEYLARLGIPPFPNQTISSSASWMGSAEGLRNSQLDISTLIYSQIPELPGEERVGKLLGDPSFGGHSTGGSWDYLDQWGPKYEPLADVFTQINKLTQEIQNSRATSSLDGIYTNPTRRKSSILLGSDRVEDDEEMSISSSQSPSTKSSVVMRGIIPPHHSTKIPPSPRSPLTTRDGIIGSPISPNFTPEISFCSPEVGIGMTEHHPLRHRPNTDGYISDGILRGLGRQSYASSESSSTNHVQL